MIENLKIIESSFYKRLIEKYSLILLKGENNALCGMGIDYAIHQA